MLAHKAVLDDAGESWSAVDLGTRDPGLLAGADVSAGDLGASGTTGPGGTVPQELDGTEALRLALDGLQLREALVALTGLGIGEAAILRTFHVAGAELEARTVEGVADGLVEVGLAGVNVASIELSAGPNSTYLVDRVVLTEDLFPA